MSRPPTVLDLGELRLIAAAKAGDKDAYAQLLRRHQVAVYHAAFLLTGSASQAQTVTLQAFVQAWSRDVLTWVQGPLTLRIEGASTLEQALALARTLR